MANRIDRAIYGAAQGLRVSWYWGQKLLAASRAAPVPVPAALRGKGPDRARLLRDLRRLLAEDWRNIEEGRYSLPAELLPNPVQTLRRTRDFFADLVSVEARRRAGNGNELVREHGHGGGYPRYYLQNFHYQTDGWLSPASAARYDHQVEVLFGGAADAMRRQALVPLGDVLRERGIRSANLLDLACGTGRFLREVKHNYPRLSVTALDLSSFYLAEARRHLAPWSRTGFVAAPAEAMPLADASFDVVTAIYLFHELPPAVRRRVAGEIMRVLKPGGRFILLDTLQRGDEPDYDVLLEQFPHGFHEPYYASFIGEDLPALFGEAGFVAEESRLAYFSKCVSFRKPEPARQARPPRPAASAMAAKARR